MSNPSSNGVNTARIVRVAATVPEVCFHNVKLGQGCFCPHCPTACFGDETQPAASNPQLRLDEPLTEAQLAHIVKWYEDEVSEPEHAATHDCHVVRAFRELRRLKSSAVETTDQRLARALHVIDEAGKLSDWINRARPVITKLMAAYERRIRSDCNGTEQLAKEPWRCAEYICAERLLADQPKAVVEIRPVEPAGFHTAKFDELANLPHNWDSYGGIPPLGNCLAKAREILPSLPGDWSIVPMSNGGIQLEQHCGGLDIELMIENSPSNGT